MLIAFFRGVSESRMSLTCSAFNLESLKCLVTANFFKIKDLNISFIGKIANPVLKTSTNERSLEIRGAIPIALQFADGRIKVESQILQWMYFNGSELKPFHQRALDFKQRETGKGYGHIKVMLLMLPNSLQFLTHKAKVELGVTIFKLVVRQKQNNALQR